MFIDKANRIRMPVLFWCKSHELPGDAYIGITFFVQLPVDLALSHELIHAVVRIVFTDKKCSSNKMIYGWKPAGCTRVPIQCSLPGITAIVLYDCILIDLLFIDLIEFFK